MMRACPTGARPKQREREETDAANRARACEGSTGPGPCTCRARRRGPLSPHVSSRSSNRDLKRSVRSRGRARLRPAARRAPSRRVRVASPTVGPPAACALSVGCSAGASDDAYVRANGRWLGSGDSEAAFGSLHGRSDGRRRAANRDM